MVDLNEKSRLIRRLTLTAIHSIGVGHVGGCLSIADVLSALYFGGIMNVDPEDPGKADRDRLVVSKGHAGPAVYAALAARGFFPEEELTTLNRFGTDLPSHCDMNRTPGVDMTAGSLGQGLSCAVGIAIGCLLRQNGACVYAIVGDGESQEGQIWEAAMLAAHRKVHNLIAFTDWNKLQIDGTVDQVNSLGDIEAKWRSFGWDAVTVDGHDPAAIVSAAAQARRQNQRPTMIVLDTVKGKGVPEIEGDVKNHNMPFGDDIYRAAMKGLE